MRKKGKLGYYVWSLKTLHKYSLYIPLLFECSINTSRHEDHTPKAHFRLVVFGWRLISAEIHREYHGVHCPESCCSRDF